MRPESRRRLVWIALVGLAGLPCSLILSFVVHGALPLAAAIGIIVGLSQWVALRPLRLRLGRWLLASALGWSLAVGLTALITIGATTAGGLRNAEVLVIAVSAGLGGGVIAAALAASVGSAVPPHRWIGAMAVGMAAAASFYRGFLSIGCPPGSVGCQFLVVGWLAFGILGLISSLGVDALVESVPDR